MRLKKFAAASAAAKGTGARGAANSGAGSFPRSGGAAGGNKGSRPHTGGAHKGSGGGRDDSRRPAASPFNNPFAALQGVVKK